MPKRSTVLGENRRLGAKLIPESFSLYGRWKIGAESCFDEGNLISTINNFLKYCTKVTVPNSCEEFSWFYTMKLDVFKVSPFISVVTQSWQCIQNHECRIQKCQSVDNMSRSLPHLRAWVMLSFSLTQKFGLSSVRLWTLVLLPSRKTSVTLNINRKEMTLCISDSFKKAFWGLLACFITAAEKRSLLSS